MVSRLRIGIYARYSADIQNPASVADQINLCKELVAQRFDEARIVSICQDAAISGATMERPGLLELLEEVNNGRIDVVVAEGLDRISRNLGDMARIHHLCRNANCRIFTSHEGEISDLHVGFKGTMNALFLKDLKDKVRRGHKASVLSGRVVASQAYGYRAVRGVTDERGRYLNGLREIYEPEAAVVRRIFSLVAEGVPVRAIVRMLNDEAVLSPAGKEWGVSSIIGSKARQAGILNNELYRGRIVWGRTKRIVDPLTGRARYVANPESEHVVTEAPEFRIIEDELWERAHALRRRNSPSAGVKLGRPRANPDLKHNPSNKAYALTGFVRCGVCGSVKTLANAGRYVCDGYRKRRICSNARGTKEEIVAERLFPALIANLHETQGLKEEVCILTADADAGRRRREEEASVLRERVRRLVDMIELARVRVEAPAKRIADLEARIRDLEVVTPVPDITLSDEEMKAILAAALTAISVHSDDRRLADPVRAALAKIVDRIELTPIVGQRSGEEISFVFKPHGWAALYCHIYQFWPGLGDGTAI